MSGNGGPPSSKIPQVLADPDQHLRQQLLFVAGDTAGGVPVELERLGKNVRPECEAALGEPDDLDAPVVDSTSVDQIGYDEDQGEAHVVFKNGRH